MTIEIYPSTLDGNPLEVFQHDETTLGEWISKNVPSFDPQLHSLNWSVELNGEIIDPSAWKALPIYPDDAVKVRYEPKGGALDAIGSLVTSVFNFVGKLFGISQPGTPDFNRSTVQGSELQGANVEANTAKRGEPIAEVAGRRKIYPSYLCPPHKYFETQEDGTTAQFIELMLCVAVGRYQILADDVLLGSTPLLSFGASAEFEIFDPGEAVTGNPAHRHWYNAPEVGATSTGGAGLELRATTDIDNAADVSAVTYAADTITATNAQSSGTGEETVWTDAFPANWDAGITLRITQPQDVIFSGGDTVQMDFSRLLPEVGMAIEIVGTNAGQYLVATHTPAGTETEEQITLSTMEGQPVTWLKSGTYGVTVGVRGLRYRIVTPGRDVIQVERLQDNGSVDTAWPGFFAGTYSGNDVSITLDEFSLEGDWAGPYYACPQGKVTNRIEWDVFFTRGLCTISDKGNIEPQSVTVEFQYRDAAVGGEWSSIVKEYTGSTRDQLGYTETVELGSVYRPECRMRRIGAKSDDTQVSDDVEWYGMRSQLDAANSYAGVTTVAARIRGGERLSSQSENKFAVVATRILPVRRDGEWQPEQPTREIDAWLCYAANKSGYTDGQLVFSEIDRLGDIWRARGDYYDAIIDSGTTKETMRDCLAAGFAELTLDNGMIKPMRDDRREVPGYSFVADDITEDLEMSFQAQRPDDYDGIDVEYHDGTVWKNLPIECRAPGDLGQRIQKLKLPYITNATQAYRIGMRRRMEQKYRRWGYAWGAHMTALNCNFGDAVAVTTSVPGYGQSSVMFGYQLSGGNAVIELSEPPQWEDGENHFIGVSRRDGTLEGPIAVTPGPDDYSVICPALSFTPNLDGDELPPRVHFGKTPWFNVIVTRISPQESEDAGATASLEAVNNDLRVYGYDDAIAPT